MSLKNGEKDNGEKDTEKLKIGIIGTGRMAEARASAVAKMENTHLSWVCSRQSESGKKFARKHNIEKVITDWQQGCQDKEIDAVIITTPNSLHEKMACLALENNRHVLLEYPLAASQQEAEKIITTADKSRAKLHSGLTHRSGGRHLAIKEALADLGQIGSVISIQCSGNKISRWFDDKDKIGNVFVASCFHYIDQLVSWLGKVEWVDADLREKADGNLISYDLASVMLRFEKGVSAYLAYARGYPQPGLGFELKIIGDKGYLVEENQDIKLLTPDKKEDLQIEKKDSVLADTILFTKLISGEETPPYSPADDLYAIKVAESAWQAAVKGKRIYPEQQSI